MPGTKQLWLGGQLEDKTGFRRQLQTAILQAGCFSGCLIKPCLYFVSNVSRQSEGRAFCVLLRRYKSKFLPGQVRCSSVVFWVNASRSRKLTRRITVSASLVAYDPIEVRFCARSESSSILNESIFLTAELEELCATSVAPERSSWW